MFKSIKLEDWNQFEKIDINFNEKLTILTGANGAGKTTILKILNEHFGWSNRFAATPQKDEKDGKLKFFINMKRLLGISDGPNSQHIIGNIYYSDGSKSDITVPNAYSQLYNININNKKSVNGIFIPSHRPIYKYSKVYKIPTEVRTKKQVYDLYCSSIKGNYLINETTSVIVQHVYEDKLPTHVIKEMLISLATFGHGNSVIMPNPELLKMFDDFEKVLKQMLPKQLGFEKFIIEVPEVILKTKSGNFILDSVSGGIAAIIDIAWQIFMYSDDKNIVVTIDEPENHLHPQMQRNLLPNLIKAFPRAQFIIATHNPFIVSSVPDSKVYVLDFNKDNRVVSKELDLINRAGSSNDILREVLGVPFTMPIWVEDKIDDIIKKYSKLNINSQILQELRSEMKSIGLEKIIPDTIVKVVEESEAQK